MESFDCYDIFKDEKARKRAMEIEAIAYRRTKAMENRIRLAEAAIENHDIETVCAAFQINTTIAEKLDRMDPDERKRALEDARRSAKEQQDKLAKVQHQQWEKEHKIKYGYVSLDKI